MILFESHNWFCLVYCADVSKLDLIPITMWCPNFLELDEVQNN